MDNECKQLKTKIDTLEDSNEEISRLLEEYEAENNTYKTKVEEKDELNLDLQRKLELLKEQAESFNLEQKQQLHQQALQNEVYIRDLKDQIKKLEQHLSHQKQTGDTKSKELEDELAKSKKEYLTKMDLKQQELNQL